jgi:hypothetical protein
MRPSWIISSNPARGTHSWRMSCSSSSRSGGPGSRPVARKKWPPWLLKPCAQYKNPSLTRLRARKPVSWLSSSRASSAGLPVCPDGQPPCGKDQTRRPIGYRYSSTRWKPSLSAGMTSAKSGFSTNA